MGWDVIRWDGTRQDVRSEIMDWMGWDETDGTEWTGCGGMDRMGHDRIGLEGKR